MPMNSNWFNPIFLYLMYSLPYILCSYLYVARVMCSESGLLLQVGEGKKKFPVEIESFKLDFHLGGRMVNNCHYK